MKAIIVGASSGIGEALAYQLAYQGYELGIAARRIGKLEEIKRKVSSRVEIAKIDVTAPDANVHLRQLIEEMGGVDLVILSSGIGFSNPDLELDKETATIDVNVTGFCRMATEAMRYFFEQKRGHLVGISSIGALRGSWRNPSYNASKAFVSRYLQGFHYMAKDRGLPITVTDIKPGYVRTPMTAKMNMFWDASAEEAARQIYWAISKKKKHAYITRRWRLMAWVTKLLPDWLYLKVR